MAQGQQDGDQGQQRPEKLDSQADRVEKKAENRASTEAEGGKDSFYEDVAKRSRALTKSRENGLRTGTHELLGTPTIDGTAIKGGAPSKATITEQRLKEQMQQDASDSGKPGSAEQTGTVVDYKPVQNSKSSFSLSMDYIEQPDTRTPVEKLGDFMQAATHRATDPEGWKAWAQGEINKFAGIGAGLNEAKEETKAAVAAGWKALTDGTVVEFLSHPNAINAPVFKTVANAFDALSKGPEAVNHAFGALGRVVINASEGYSNLPDYEKGKVIGNIMFGMVNPEGSTEGAEAALKVADKVATHVDKAVMNTVQQTLKAVEEAAKSAPEVAQQTRQMLYDYLKSKGLTGPELEAAGIPKGYFDGLPGAQQARADNGILKMTSGPEGMGPEVPKKPGLEATETQSLEGQGNFAELMAALQRNARQEGARTLRVECEFKNRRLEDIWVRRHHPAKQGSKYITEKEL